MNKAGLVSITFRKHSPDALIELCGRAGVEAIEWGGDVHVPHGDVETARRVGEATRAAGLEVACYGSYYRSLDSEENGLSFESVLDAALALGAPRIRVWAGQGSPEAFSDERRAAITGNLRDIAERAEAKGVRICLEYHRNTLTETTASTVRLLEEVGHPNLRTLWQPTIGLTHAQALESLRAVSPWLEYFHVYSWGGTPGEVERYALAAGEMRWLDYLRAAPKGTAGYALIEFVKGDTLEQFIEDARVLKRWLL